VGSVDTKLPWLCCAEAGTTTRSIELSSIAGVTSHQSRSWCDCGFSADGIDISLNSELGLATVPPLHVQKGSGWQVAQLIQAAVEEDSRAPGAQSMIRTGSATNLPAVGLAA
jgi:hypothetical protein